MARWKGLLLLALLVCCTMQVVVGQSYDEGRSKRGMSPEEEERRAKEMDWRRREKIAEEERRHRRRWEEEEKELPPRRRWEEEEKAWRPPEPYVPPGGRGRDIFVMRESKRVISTEAGEMRVVRGYGGRIVERPLHIGFITMEPRTLFVPQYLDSTLILFLRRGMHTLRSIYPCSVHCLKKWGNVGRVREIE